MERLAFIGLGVMGSPMAGHLLRQGFDVAVYNRSPEKMYAFAERHGCRIADSARAATVGARFVVSCVGNDDDLRALATHEDGVLADLESGAVWIDHTTTSRALAEEVALLTAQSGGSFLDAPVSGGEAGAKNGQLSIMVGGSIDALGTAETVLRAYAKRIEHVGPSGSGQLAKMVNQICIAGTLQGLSEALDFGERAGLDMTRVLNVISQGAAQSWQLDNRAETMLERRFDFGFAVDWMCKDLALCLDEAMRSGARLDVTRVITERYRNLSQRGYGGWDTSSLILLLGDGID